MGGAGGTVGRLLGVMVARTMVGTTVAGLDAVAELQATTRIASRMNPTNRINLIFIKASP